MYIDGGIKRRKLMKNVERGKMMKKHKTSKNKGNLLLTIYFMIIVILCLTTFSIFYFKEKILSIGNSNISDYEQYNKHYVLITNNRDTAFWEVVYESAKEEAKKDSAYIEYMGKDLSTDYNVKEYLRIAIDCNVDGIIIEADESDEVAKLIDEAEEKGIRVVTVLKDSLKSNRQSFIGINNYTLGQLYGQQVLEIQDKNTKRILVLMNSNDSVTNQNIIYSSLKETIKNAPQKNKPLQIDNIMVNNENVFSSEEAIRDIIMDEAISPNIMICLSGVDTQCAYQAVVDHNKVGIINILGYYSTPDILTAVKKKIIHSTILIDASQMGSLAVQALNDSIKGNRVSEYLPVDIELITLANVDSYMEKIDEGK